MTEAAAPDPLAILSSGPLRERPGAAAAALAADLSRFVWANEAGGRILGLGSPGPLGSARPGPMPFQLRAAERTLRAGGPARLAMRLPGRASMTPIVADLVRGPDGSFVLLLVSEGTGRKAWQSVDPAARLLREAGGGRPGEAGGRIAILDRKGALAAADPGFPLERLPAFMDEATAFRHSVSDWVRTEIEDVPLTLARLSEGFLALRIDDSRVSPRGAPGLTALDSTAPETPIEAAATRPIRRAGAFSTRRRALPGGTARPPLGVLISAWSAPRAALPPVPAAKHDAPPESAAPALPAAIQAEAQSPGPSARAGARTRLRSRWDAPQAPRSAPAPGETAAPAAPGPDDVSVPASDTSSAPRESQADEAPADGPESVAPASLAPASRESADAATPRERAAPSGPTPETFRARFDIGPVRFSWQIDADGRFRFLSPEFAAAVGPRSAAVTGRSFAEIATLYGLDPDGEVGRLLARRETWSGRSIEWPVEGSDRKVPTDLAALPTFGRDRSFEGFRGFGILRMSESVSDPEAIGLVVAGTDEADRGDRRREDLRAALMAAPVFGRRAPPPAELVAAGAEATPGSAPKVIRLEERRRQPREGLLTPDEEDAFRAIGSTLKEPGDTEHLSRAVIEASERLRSSAATDGSEDEGRGPDEAPGDIVLGDLEPIFAGLPLPILVQMREALVAANAEFRDLTGYPSVSALREAGGLAHLFADSGPRNGELLIRRANGALLDVRVHMQRAQVRGRSCLIMSFSPSASAAATAATGRGERTGPPLGDHRRAREDSPGEAEPGVLAAVTGALTLGVVTFDAANRIASMDGAARDLFGISPNDGAGRPLPSLFALDSQRPLVAALDALGRREARDDGRDGEPLGVIGRGGDGHPVPLLAALGRLDDGSGWCALLSDGAARRGDADPGDARHRAEAASIEKSRFLATISHEMRTPLNAIIGFADVMTAEPFGPLGSERYLEYLSDIKRSGHHLLDLVNDLLDISKIEAGKWDLDARPLALNDIVTEAVALMQTEAQRGRVIVRTNLPRSVPPVEADERSVRQIALNLLANAIHFTPAGGQIVASTSHASNGEVILRFRDTGIGMTGEEIAVALTPFGQVRGPGRTAQTGTGLGLPLSKAMTEANEARFTIASVPGEGTVVEIAFPARRVVTT